MFTFNSKYVFWGILLLAGLSLFGYVVRLSGQVAHYRTLADQNEVTIEALKDSTRVITDYWEDAELRVVVARKAIPDIDSLRASVRDATRNEILAAGGTLTGSVTVTTEHPEVDINGEGESESTSADSLFFEFEDDSEFALTKGELWVYPLTKRMAYNLRLIPKPEIFRFYTVEFTLPSGTKGIEFWVDAPGIVHKMDTYIAPSALPPRDAPVVKRQFYAGLRAMGSSEGWFAIGPEVGTRGKLWILDMEIGAGIDISRPTYYGFGQLKIGVTF